MECYGLNRFSEDIDLDGSDHSFIEICKRFAKKHGYEVRIAKDTDIVKRCMIHYGGTKPLKVELSSRRAHIDKENVVQVNGIEVYNIDTLAILKGAAYQQRDKIRDLFDITFIINNYFEHLSPATRLLLQNALEYKGIEHFDYLVETQFDELIDTSKLAEDFLKACDNAGVLLDSNEREDFVNENITPYIALKPRKSKSR